MNSPELYVITDPNLCKDHELALKVEQALKAGAQWIQYRDKRPLSFKQKLTLCAPLKTLCDQFNARFVINDHLDLAMELDADLHLGQTDTDHTHAIQRLKPHQRLGITCHNQPELAHHAAELGAYYVAFGALFHSTTKLKASLCDPEVLTRAHEQLTQLPSPPKILAIGGISLENMQQLDTKPVDIIALCNAIWSSADIVSSCRAFFNRRT